MAPLLKPTMEQFVHEILGDLLWLVGKYPKGIMIHHLHEEYGESPARILKAISLLEEKSKVRVYKAANNSSYILPFQSGPPDELGGLSDLQRSTCLLLRQICLDNNTTLVRTNYTQLARLLNCSGMGIRTCIDRLVQLGYLAIVAPSKQGKQSELLLRLEAKLLPQIRPLD